jgi:hypothetical protein
MFAAADQDWEIEEAYKGAQVVLQHLGQRSPQAAQHVNVLSCLYSAIIKQRQVLTSRNREKSGSMVAKVMTLQPRAPASTAGPGENDGRPVGAGGPDDLWLHDFTFLDDAHSQVDCDDSALPWQNFSPQMWDPFPFDGKLGPS